MSPAIPKKKLPILLCILLMLSLMLMHVLSLSTSAVAPVPATRSAELGLILLDEEDGLFILAVTEHSPAQRAGFMAGDLLLSVGDTHLTSATLLEGMLTQSTAGLPILLERDGEQLTLTLPTSKDLAKWERKQYTNLMNGGEQS